MASLCSSKIPAEVTTCVTRYAVSRRSGLEQLELERGTEERNLSIIRVIILIILHNRSNKLYHDYSQHVMIYRKLRERSRRVIAVCTVMQSVSPEQSRGLVAEEYSCYQGGRNRLVSAVLAQFPVR